jgi:3-oxo-5-alpha-steroid 4-dehydrogenase 1
MTPLVLVELVAAAIVFPVLFFIPAPYGRHGRAGWGPTMNARAGWMLMELPAVVVPLLAFPGGAGAVLLVAWEVHYVQRTFVFPLRMRGSGRPNPILIVALALAFNILNGWINFRALAGWRFDVWAVAGLAVFAAGLAINWHSDAVLRDLRAGGRTGYTIPRRGLFRWVSAANYFGEIVEWAGFALAARTWAAAAFALFTIANLAPRAFTHHKLYREQFPDYPAERKALVPWLL